MANLHRIRSNFKSGTLGANLLTTVTTIDFGVDPGFATLGTDEYLILVIDPEGAGNGPEIVYLTAYTATNTTGTIERGKEGTSDPGVTHASGTVWRHGPTAMDFDRMVWAQDEDDPSSVANVDFDISGFETVRIVGWLKPATDAQILYLRLSNDGGSSFRSGASDYAWVGETHNISNGVWAEVDDNSDSEIQVSGTNGVGNGSGEYIQVDIRIENPAESGVFTSVIAEVPHMVEPTPLHVSWYVRGIVVTAEANDAVRLLFASGNIDSGHLTMYGYPSI